MRFLRTLALAAGALDAVAAAPQIHVRDQPDSQTLAAYQQSGMCMFYFKTGNTPNWNKGLQPCIKYCADHGGHGYSECDVGAYNGMDPEKMPGYPIYHDDDKHPWVPARCKCENKNVEGLSNAIVDIVAKGLSKLDNVLCAVMVSAFEQVAEIGLHFIPGGPEVKVAVKGIDKAIQFAKSAYQNNMSGGQFYTDWVGQACHVPGWHFDLDDMLTNMASAPDSMMGDNKPTGCVLNDKSKCKALPGAK